MSQELNHIPTQKKISASRPLLTQSAAGGNPYGGPLERKDDEHSLLTNEKPLHFNQNDEQAAQPFVNNQNSILMAARSCNGDLMLMHETRIFYFSSININDEHPPNDLLNNNNQLHEHKSVSDDKNNYPEAAEYLTNLILGMLMTRKYRLITSFYTLWHILDYTMLAALVCTVFFNGKSDSFETIVRENIWIFAAVAVELFYDVLEFIVKIWILNRVSLYIGIILYIIYVAVFVHHEVFEDQLVIALLIARFVAFVFEETIDFCIDLELDYDLRERTIHTMEIPQLARICGLVKPEQEERIAILKVGNHNEIQLPKGWQFKGSVCVWTYKNAFNLQVHNEEKNWSMWNVIISGIV